MLSACISSELWEGCQKSIDCPLGSICQSGLCRRKGLNIIRSDKRLATDRLLTDRQPTDQQQGGEQSPLDLLVDQQPLDQALPDFRLPPDGSLPFSAPKEISCILAHDMTPRGPVRVLSLPISLENSIPSVSMRDRVDCQEDRLWWHIKPDEGGESHLIALRPQLPSSRSTDRGVDDKLDAGLDAGQGSEQSIELSERIPGLVIDPDWSVTEHCVLSPGSIGDFDAGRFWRSRVDEGGTLLEFFNLKGESPCEALPVGRLQGIPLVERLIFQPEPNLLFLETVTPDSDLRSLLRVELPEEQRVSPMDQLSSLVERSCELPSALAPYRHRLWSPVVLKDQLLTFTADRSGSQTDLVTYPDTGCSGELVLTTPLLPTEEVIAPRISGRLYPLKLQEDWGVWCGSREECALMGRAEDGTVHQVSFYNQDTMSFSPFLFWGRVLATSHRMLLFAEREQGTERLFALHTTTLREELLIDEMRPLSAERSRFGSARIRPRPGESEEDPPSLQGSWSGLREQEGTLYWELYHGPI